MSKSNQSGVSRDPEVLVRPSRRIIGDPDKLQILAELDLARASSGGMVLAGPHVMDLVHLPCVRLVQDSVMQHQYPGVQPNLSLHLQPQCVVGWLKPVQQKGIRIMRGLNRTNRVGPLSIHRRRIHRCGDQEVDEVFIGDFSLVKSY
jgi:hypothetical protein